LIIAGKRKYRVNFSGAFRSVYFLEKGVYHAVVSSHPLPSAHNSHAADRRRRRWQAALIREPSKATIFKTSG
jgi:hypothetical protein